MLFEGENITFLTVAQVALSALIGLFGIAAGLNGFLSKPLNIVFRIMLIGAGVCMMIPGTLSDVIGLAVIAAIVVIQKLTSKKTPQPAA